MLVAGPVALLTLGTYGSRFNPGAWWLISLMGALVVRTGAQRGSTDLERRYVRYVGCAAVVWLSLAWQAGPYRPALILPMLALAPLAVLPWAVYRRLRRLPTIDWPRARGRARTRRAARAYAREMRSALKLQVRAMARYSRMRRGWYETSCLRSVGLLRSAIVAGHWSPSGPAWLDLELGGGKTLEDVRAAAPALEVEWHLRPGTLRPRRIAEAHQVRLEFKTVAELAPPPAMLPWPAKPPRTVKEPLRLGEFSGRQPVLLPLIQPKDGRLAPHVQVTGQTGWGKGSFVNCLLAETALVAEVEHWGIDAKGGVELGPWTGLFRDLADDGEQAVALLERLTAEMKRRWAVLREQGRRFWVPTAAQPLLIVVVDEWGALPTKAKDLLDVLLAQARAAGIWFVLCTQRASAAKTGGSGQTGDAKSQLGMTVSYNQLPGDEDLSYGEGAKRAGWRTDLLDRPGLALIRWMGRYDQPDPWQTYWVSDEVVTEVAAQAALRRGPRPSDEEASADERDPSVRPMPPPTEATEDVQPTRPALHLLNPVANEDPLDRLLGLLAAAPEDGVERAELIRQMGMSDSWVDQALVRLRAAGLAVKVARARWRRPVPDFSVVARRT